MPSLLDWEAVCRPIRNLLSRLILPYISFRALSEPFCDDVANRNYAPCSSRGGYPMSESLRRREHNNGFDKPTTNLDRTVPQKNAPRLGAIGVASAGAAGIGALGLTRRFGSQTANEPEYTNYTLAQADSSNIKILVAWYGTYDTGNGQELLTGQPIDDGEWDYNNTAGYGDDVASTIEQSGPVVAIDGDESDTGTEDPDRENTDTE